MHRQTHRLHFEEYSGEQFENLCYAFLARDEAPGKLEWNGQGGGDGGRDIIHYLPGGSLHVYQCANYSTLTLTKVSADLTKIAHHVSGRNVDVTFICGGRVSASLRRRAEEEGRRKQIRSVSLWSGPEFEVRLRRDSPDLIRQFFEGVPFPNAAAQGLAAPTRAAITLRPHGRTWLLFDNTKDTRNGNFAVEVEFDLYVGSDRVRLLTVEGIYYTRREEECMQREPVVRIDGRVLKLSDWARLEIAEALEPEGVYLLSYKRTLRPPKQSDVPSACDYGKLRFSITMRIGSVAEPATYECTYELQQNGELREVTPIA